VIINRIEFETLQFLYNSIDYVSTFMDCIFNTNKKKGIVCHSLNFEPYKLIVASKTNKFI